MSIVRHVVIRGQEPGRLQRKVDDYMSAGTEKKKKNFHINT